jgi:hypothetical protein
VRAEQIEDQNDRPTFVPSVESQLIERRLMEIEVGGLIDYDELSTIAGRDVQQDARSLVTSARRRAFNTDGRCFGVIRGAGLKRLSDEEVVDSSDVTHIKIRNASRRMLRTLTLGVQDFAGMSREKQVKHNASISAFGAIAHFSGVKAMKQIADAVRNKGTVVSVADVSSATLDSFSKRDKEES